MPSINTWFIEVMADPVREASRLVRVGHGGPSRPEPAPPYPFRPAPRFPRHRSSVADRNAAEYLHFNPANRAEVKTDRPAAPRPYIDLVSSTPASFDHSFPRGRGCQPGHHSGRDLTGMLAAQPE